MPELTPAETLQPSLLDRLTDHEPGKQVESRENRVLSIGKLREAVIRDLSWLLNSGNLESTEVLAGYPYAEASVLNFGMRDLTGLTESTVNRVDLERLVIEAVKRFEPRILPDTIKVKIVVEGDQNTEAGNRIAFEIEGDLWARPLPEHLFLQTEVDLENGLIKVESARG